MLGTNKYEQEPQYSHKYELETRHTPKLQHIIFMCFTFKSSIEKCNLKLIIIFSLVPPLKVPSTENLKHIHDIYC